MKKTICYVLAEFPVLSETFIGNEIRAIKAQGHDVSVVVMKPRDDTNASVEDKQLAQSALRLENLGLTNALSGLVRAHENQAKAIAFARAQKGIRARSLLWNGAKIAGIAQRMGAAHIHAHFAGGAAAHAIVAAQLCGASVSFVCHGHDVYAEARDLQQKLAAADCVVAVCSDLADDLRSIEPRTHIREVPCGVDPRRFTPRDEESDNGRWLFIGRLVAQKGVDDLIRALALVQHNGVAIDIVGDGVLRQDIEALAAQCGIGDQALRFLGARSNAWIAQEGRNYRGLVAPFKTAPDGARDTGPVVVKEAMAMGLPIVATAFMGLKEIVSDNTGCLVPVGDPVSLARAISKLNALSTSERRRMGSHARERIDTLFSLERQGELLSRAIEALP